jgi:hypothetical protein
MTKQPIRSGVTCDRTASPPPKSVADRDAFPFNLHIFAMRARLETVNLSASTVPHGRYDRHGIPFPAARIVQADRKEQSPDRLPPDNNPHRAISWRRAG